MHRENQTGIREAQSGTYRLDGLLEGPLDSDGAARARLTDWVRVAQKAGYGFSLEFDASGFSLLGDNTARHAPSLDVDMAEPLRDLLGQLVGSFPPDLRPRLFSTVRSVQYGEGLETQTIYAVMPDGSVDAQQRTVDAETSRAAEPLSVKGALKRGAMALVVLLALFGLSSIFIDWGDLASKAWRKVAPVDADAIKTETGSFARYLTVESVEAKAGTLHITLARTDAFPQTVAALEGELQDGAHGYAARQSLHALAAGYLRLEAFDAEAKHLDTVMVRVADLRTNDTTVVKLTIRRETPPALLSLTW